MYFTPSNNDNVVLSNHLYPMKNVYPERSCLFQDDNALIIGQKGSLNGLMNIKI